MEPEPAAGGQGAPDTRAAWSARGLIRQVALGTVVFAATLLLLVGATRLVERGAGAPGPGGTLDGAAATASGTTTPGTTPAAGSPSGGPSPGGPGSPGTSAAPTGSPVPSPAPAGDPVLVGAGDIGDCGSPGDEATAELLDTLPGTVFTTGDNAYESGTLEQFQACYDPSWGRHRERTRPVPGNHDWETDALAGYVGYFGELAQGSGGTSWYGYELGTWQVLALDSKCDKIGGCGPDSPMGRWLAAELAGSRARCTVAYFHHPRWSSGQHGDAPEVDPLWRQLYAAGVDVVLNGHDHDYERFAPQDPEGIEDRERGIRQFIVGTGGAPLRDFDRVAPNSELRASVAHGVLGLTLHDGSYDWAFHAAGSDFSDRGTARCH